MPATAPTLLPAKIWTRFDAVAQPAVADLGETGIIKGVSICTIGPASGHTAWAEDGTPCQVMVDMTTLEQLLALCNKFATGLKSRTSHYSAVIDICAFFNTFSIDKEKGKLLGDYHLFETHPHYSHLRKLFETVWDQFGTSIDFEGHYEIDIANRLAYARVERLVAADLTTDPAANPDGAFEKGSRPQPVVVGNKTVIQPVIQPAPFDTNKKNTAPLDTNKKTKSMHTSLRLLVLKFAAALKPAGKRFDATAADEAAPAADAPATVESLAADMAEVIIQIKTLMDSIADIKTKLPKEAASKEDTSGAAPAAEAAMAAITQLGNRFSALELKFGIQQSASGGAKPAAGLTDGGEAPVSGSPEALRQEWEAMKDPQAKTVFFRKNRAEILKAK